MQVTIFFLLWWLCTILEATWVIMHGALLATSDTRQPHTINLWPFQPHNMNVRYNMLSSKTFLCALAAKRSRAFVNSSLPIPHVPSPASSFQNSSIAVFTTNNQKYAFEFSYLWSSASTIVSYGAFIHFHCQLVFYIVLCQWNFYLYFLLIACCTVL